MTAIGSKEGNNTKPNTWNRNKILALQPTIQGRPWYYQSPISMSKRIWTWTSFDCSCCTASSANKSAPAPDLFWTESGDLWEKKKKKTVAAQRETEMCVAVRIWGDEGLTRSAFVPDNEVFTAARALVCPKHTAVDKDLTAPSVLALVQHFLRREKATESGTRPKRGLEGCANDSETSSRQT